MLMVSGEILEIESGTPWPHSDGLGIACRATNPLGKIQVFYVAKGSGPTFALGLMGTVAMVATDASDNTEAIEHVGA